MSEGERRGYPPPSEEIEQAVKALFDRCDKFELRAREDGYYLAAERMYGYVSFADEMSVLQGYMKIAQLLGCKDGDEVGRSHSSGCSTCDYGSSYEVELRFW